MHHDCCRVDFAYDVLYAHGVSIRRAIGDDVGLLVAQCRSHSDALDGAKRLFHVTKSTHVKVENLNQPHVYATS